MKIIRNKSLKKIKELIQSPLSFRDQGDDGLKTQLAEVRFGECLYYSKSSGLQTNEDLVLYKILKDLITKNTSSYDEVFQNQTKSYLLFSNLLDVCKKKLPAIEMLVDYKFSLCGTY